MLESGLNSLPPTKRGDWIIQGSIYRNESICIVAWNPASELIHIRYFRDEEDARKFVCTF